MDKIVQKFKVDGNEIIFRYIEDKDAIGIFELRKSLFKEKAMTGMNEKPDMKNIKESLDQRLNKIKNKEMVDLVVEIEGEIKGRAWITKIQDPCQNHIGTIGIHIKEEIRGRGVADKLIKTLIKESKKVLRIKMVTLGVMIGNKRAIKFYLKNGFKKNDILKKGIKYFGKYVDEVYMVKYL